MTRIREEEEDTNWQVLHIKLGAQFHQHFQQLHWVYTDNTKKAKKQ